MKSMKFRSYPQFLKSEYHRLRKGSGKNRGDAVLLRNMDDLLKHIENLKSPEKERVFVEGILQLNHIPSIAA